MALFQIYQLLGLTLFTGTFITTFTASDLGLGVYDGHDLRARTVEKYLGAGEMIDRSNPDDARQLENVFVGKTLLLVLTIMAFAALAPGLLAAAWVFDIQMVMTAISAILVGRQFNEVYSEFYEQF